MSIHHMSLLNPQLYHLFLCPGQLQSETLLLALCKVLSVDASIAKAVDVHARNLLTAVTPNITSG